MAHCPHVQLTAATGKTGCSMSDHGAHRRRRGDMTEKRTALLVLDLDGTVRHGYDELGRFVNHPEDVVIFPEALMQMRRWKEAGGRIIAVSNQGGISLGFMPMSDCVATMQRTHELCECLFDRIAWCQHHPDAKDPEYARCWCRKPSPGLLIEAALDLAAQTRQSGNPEIYPPHLGLFVGDREEDRECARISGFDFKWANDWRAEYHEALIQGSK